VNRPAARPLPRWFLILLGVLVAVIFVVMVIVAIVDPTQEVLIGLASIVIPATLFGGSVAIRSWRGRR